MLHWTARESEVASYEQTQETLAVLEILALGNRKTFNGHVSPGVYFESIPIRDILKLLVRSIRYNKGGYLCLRSSQIVWRRTISD